MAEGISERQQQLQHLEPPQAPFKLKLKLAMSAPRLRVIPEPIEYTLGSTPIRLADDFQIHVPATAADDLKKAAEESKERLSSNTHRFLSATDGEEFKDKQPAWLSKLKLEIDYTLDDAGEDADGDAGIVKRSIKAGAQVEVKDRAALEKYELHVGLDGEGIIRAPSAVGLLRGLTTFEQLFYCDGPPRISAQYAPYGAYHIKDEPSFGWRGLMLDTARNWFSANTIKRTLLTMSMVKLNQFHWHITDSQSFPLQLNSHKELAQAAYYSFDEGGNKISKVYTEDDVRDIIDFAGEHGIDVMIEIDTPGHTAAIGTSHPEHMVSLNAEWYHTAAIPPAGELRFASPNTTQWTRGIFESLVDVTQGRYVGTGGDEISHNAQLADEETKRLLAERGGTEEEALDGALDDFHRAVHGAILHGDKMPVVWQDLILKHDLAALNKSTLVHVWQGDGPQTAAKVIDKGYQVIYCPGTPFYLDNGQSQWITTKHGEDGSPYHSWPHIIAFNPFANLTSHQAKQIVGGQGNMWTEQTNEHDLDSKLWPRVAAVAALWWEGDRKGSEPYPRDATRLHDGMHDVRARMEKRGVGAASFQPEWTAKRPGVGVEEGSPYGLPN